MTANNYKIRKWKKLLSPIVKEYDLRNELQLAKLENIVSENAKSVLMKKDCGRTLKNCKGVAAGAALVVHTVCLAADPTIILGAICHAGVIALQYYATVGRKFKIPM